MELAFLLMLLGANLMVWSVIGTARFTSERLGWWPGSATRGTAGAQNADSTHSTDTAGSGNERRRLTPDDVAVLIPAHNEEPVIAASIASVLRLVERRNIHVVADGCEDQTAAIARSCGVSVLELNPGRGKAGGIETAITHFRLRDRFAVLLIVDADTELDEHYLERGLPLLDEPGMVALAGYARAGWRPRELSLVGRYLVSYRTRLYAVMQWLKYGQTWRFTNVTAIVPGFASMYRTDILDSMDLNPPGLVIEDFNMTFELHHKRLGKIAFRPAVYATTQDPDAFRDYYRQVLRWNLGFWQTIRRHRLWRSGFSAALVLFLIEVIVASIGIVLLATWVLVSGLLLLGEGVLAAGGLIGPPDLTGAFVTLTNLLLFLALPDYLLTCLTAIAVRRPSLLLYGVGFLLLRFVDATAMLVAIPRAWRTRSNGQWRSPARRPVPVASAPAGQEGTSQP